MSEVLVPPWIEPDDEQHELLDEGSSVFSAAFAPGLTQRQSYGGLRLKLSRNHTVRADEKAQLLSLLRSTRGRYNSVRSKVHFILRGSFPATELLSNNTFADGTTGWSAQACALSVSDRMLQLALGADHSATPAAFRAGISVTQYAPLVARCAVTLGKGVTAAGVLVGAGNPSASNAVAAGIATASLVADAATASFYAGILSTPTTWSPGDSIFVPWASLSRCALIDNGVNTLVRSDEFDNASWTKTAVTVTANDGGTLDPIGTNTADNSVETTATSGHYVSQALTVSSAAHDRCFAVAVKTLGRSHCWLGMDEGGATSVTQYFNLSTGVAGTSNVGAGWSNLRSFSFSLGNGWWYFAIVARKTTAATALAANVGAATADGTNSYAGNSSFGQYNWRGTCASSSVPVRLVQTTSAASTGTAQTGSALHVKGLPASTNGLLLLDDVFEINGELKTCTAALNSDAAGLGYLQFEPALVRSPADNDPVIVLDPMGKFLMSNLKIGNEYGVQANVSYDLEHIYE